MIENKCGRVTVPTDVDMVAETREVVARWGADAIRDCDGTDMPEELLELPVKVYSTYYTTRKDNEWARANPDEVQQVYLMTEFYMAQEERLTIPLMEHFYEKQLCPNHIHDPKRWWEVIDRTTGEVHPPDAWSYCHETRILTIEGAVPYHEYTVSFLAFIIWDPVHMYNYITNDWSGVEPQMTYDVRQPKTKVYVLKKLRRWLEEHPGTDVVRFTTFFHQFTLIFDEYGREKMVDWFGYSASVSPYILEQFEEEYGYRFRPEFIIDQGYHNNTFRVPTQEFKDFMDFQQREVAALVKEFVDICHEYGKEAMMFLGDHWIGTEPFGKYFRDIGVDAVVGSVGNGTTLRLISEIPGVKYTEGRFLPYFFPDVFCEGGDPLSEARENWMTARRALLQKPLDRIGYGGYLKLALDFPEFMEYIDEVCDEFRCLYQRVGREKPHHHFTVGILNCWGAVRSWGTHMVAHAKPYKQTYSYAGILEALSGMPFDVKFISFDQILENPDVLMQCQVLINTGDAGTANSGGHYWKEEKIQCAVRNFVDNGGGFIGVGEPTAYPNQGRYFALAGMLGVEKEAGYGMSANRYNWEVNDHFITAEIHHPVDFGEGMKNVYALPGSQVLDCQGEDVQLAVNTFGSGRSVYISGLPYSHENARLLYRALFWAAGREADLKRWYADNCSLEVQYYPATSSWCVVNNTDQVQEATVYEGDGTARQVTLNPGEIRWYDSAVFSETR